MSLVRVAFVLRTCLSSSVRWVVSMLLSVGLSVGDCGVPRPAGALEAQMGALGEIVSLESLRGDVVLIFSCGVDDVSISAAAALGAAVQSLNSLELRAWSLIERSQNPIGGAIGTGHCVGANNAIGRQGPLQRLTRNEEQWEDFACIPEGGAPQPHLIIVDRNGIIQEEHSSLDTAYWAAVETNASASLSRWLSTEAGPVAPALPANSVVDAASFTPALQPDGLPAYGSIVSIFGSNFAGQLAVAQTTPLPASLDGVSVKVGGRPLPLFFVSAGQINAQLPYAEAALAASRGVAQGGPADLPIVVTNANGSSVEQRLAIAATSPSIFTFDQSGGGQGVVVFANTATVAGPPGLAGDSRPARAGDLLSIFANGLGAVTPSIEPGRNSCDPDGTCLPDFSNLVLRHAAARPAVEIGGVPVPDANILFAGLAPEFVALFQINLTLPEGVPGGDAVPIVIRQGGTSSRSDVTIAVDAPMAASVGDAVRGKALFESKCSVCHFADSTNTKVGPGLAGVRNGTLPSGLPATVENLSNEIRTGGNGAPSFEKLLTAQERADVIAYVLTL